MNHVFKLVWNRALGMLVPVPEVVTSPGRGGRRMPRRARRKMAAQGRVLAAVAIPLSVVLFPLSAVALPTGGQVVSGQAALQTSGSTLNVNQTSQKATINYQSFNVGANETVNFRQPGSSSITLNQVLGSNASAIYGHINANGQVFLVNPNGIYFAPGAQVNVGGLIASTEAISAQDLAKGTVSFSGNSPNSVVNKGTITAAKGGYVAFIGAVVDNEGKIITPNGTTALGAGSAVDLSFSSNSLAHFQVSSAALNAAVKNGGAIIAPNGAVILTAQAKNALLQTVVNNTGIIQAQGVAQNGGDIQLLGGASGTVENSGMLDASSATGTGGLVQLSGQNVVVHDGTKIIATGSISGGTVNVGGAMPARGVIEAAHTTIANNVVINASGPGGGKIETSGRVLSLGSAAITAGAGGTWLLDPTNLTIGTSAATAIDTALNANTNVIEQTTGSSVTDGSGAATQTSGAGDINIVAPLSWSSGATLTLSAFNNVNIEAPVTISGNGGLSVTCGNNSSGTSATGTALNFLSNGNIQYIAGAGTNTAPLTINGAAYTLIFNNPQLEAVSGSGHYALANHLNESGVTGFTPIGSSNARFTGVFDGLGNNISNLSIMSTGNNVGLFGYVGSGGTVRDIGLVGGSVSGSNNVGGLVGVNNGGTISAAYATGSVSGGGTVGGLVAYNSGTISAAYATGSVSGKIFVGGLVGFNSNGSTISAAYATGSVSGSTNVGGLVGGNYGGTISAAYATGSVSGSNNVGGLVGINNGGTISAAYATGSVSGGGTVGGLVGYNYGGTISAAYATGSVSGSNNVGGLVGVNNGGTISAAYATGSVSGGGTVGGLVAYNSGTISAAYATGSVSGKIFVGGLVGFNSNGSTISAAYATGSVSGSTNVGGLVGVNYGGTISAAYATGSVSGGGNVGGLVGYNSGTISAAYATGSVSGGGNVGGLVGANVFAGTVTDGYWDTNSTGQRTSAGGNPLSAAQILQQSSFAGFDFTTPVWVIYNGHTTPLLAAFLTPLTIAASNQSAPYSGAASTLGFLNETKIITGTAPAGTLFGNSGNIFGTAYDNAVNVGSYAPDLYSGQQGYRITYTNAQLTINPKQLSASIIGNPTKTYNGTNGASLGTSNFSITGFVNGQGATESNLPTSGTYASANAGTNNTVTASLINVNFTGTNGTLLSNYILPTTASGAGRINKLGLTASIIDNPTKTYNSTNGATLTAANFSVTGFISGQGATESNLPTSGTYASANAGTNNTVTASLTNVNFTATNGTLLSNYILPTTASGPGTIHPELNIGLQQTVIDFGQIVPPNNLLTPPDLVLPAPLSILNGGVNAPFASDYNGAGTATQQTAANQ